MVRGVADRAFLPAKSLLEEVGDMMILTGKTIMSALRPPYPYGGEFVSQFLFALKLCWFPLVVSTVAFGYGAPGLQAANFLVLFGALDRLGGFFVLASIREFAPFVTAIVLAGVAGTAITADLGARKIREELDALQVLGVDPVKNLVVPRFLALMLVTGLFDIYALLFGIFGGILATLVNGAPLGPFWATFFTNASVTDLWGSVLKCTMFGAIIAIVCCYKGMTASGGAEGVGRAVNQAVVIAILGRVRVQLRVHADAAGHPPRDHGDQVMGLGWLAVPKDWIASFGEIVKFCSRIVGEVFSLKVLRFFGEALRQAGILILSSTIVIWGLIFIIGLQCGIEGAYFNRSVGSPAYAGVFAAWCDLRELVPYALRLHDVREGRHRHRRRARLDADLRRDRRARGHGHPVADLPVRDASCSAPGSCCRSCTWPGIGAGFFASYLAVVQQIGEVSSGGFFLIFWMFQNPPDLLYSVIKGMSDGHGASCSSAATTATTRAAARSGWVPRPRSRWCSTSCWSTSSECSAPSCSGAPTHAHRSEAEMSDDDPVARQEQPQGHALEQTQHAQREQPTAGAGHRGATAAEDDPDYKRRLEESKRDGDPDDEYQWHTGAQRPDRGAGRGRVRRGAQGVRPQQDPARPQHGHPRGQDLDDPRARRAPASPSASSTWSACCTPTTATCSSTASRSRTWPTTTSSRCARSSASCSRTARCSAR